MNNPNLTEDRPEFTLVCMTKAVSKSFAWPSKRAQQRSELLIRDRGRGWREDLPSWAGVARPSLDALRGRQHPVCFGLTPQ